MDQIKSACAHTVESCILVCRLGSRNSEEGSRSTDLRRLQPKRLDVASGRAIGPVRRLGLHRDLSRQTWWCFLRISPATSPSTAA